MDEYPRAAIHTEKIHQRERGEYIGDLVFGANDGIITAFAVVAGATGAALSSGIILILGIANLIADGISMGLSNYLSLRSRLDFESRERAQEEKEVEENPSEERREVEDILRKWGIREEDISRNAAAITSDKKKWVDMMMKEELDIIESKTDSPSKHGLATFVAFVIAGALPLTPYLFGVPLQMQFPISVTTTAVTLFFVGALRTFATGVGWLKSGLKMLGVGGLAAVAAYILGGAVRYIFGVSI